MRKMTVGMIALILVLGFAAGWGITSLWSYIDAGKTMQKPVVHNNPEPKRITKDSQIIYEQEYSRCGHIVISEFSQRDQLNGQTMSDLKEVYPRARGYEIYMQGETITIRQQIDDWCPQDKQKYRLKEYNGRVAIYQGPDQEHDILLRVTSLRLDLLPDDVRSRITSASYEFTSEEALNDVLENLDEYL